MNQISWTVLDTASTEPRPFMWRDKTQVAKIDEGWLLKFSHFHGRSSHKSTQSMVFIPDPEHKRDPEDEKNSWEWVQKRKTPNFGDYVKRLDVELGWVYLNCFFTKTDMDVSLQYIEKRSKG